MSISEIMNEQDEEAIGSEAVNFFCNQFQEEQFDGEYTLLQQVPKLITDEENELMVVLQEVSEVRDAVYK